MGDGGGRKTISHRDLSLGGTTTTIDFAHDAIVIM